MSETRRELFRTSVITAIGVAVGAVAGYEYAESGFAEQSLPPPTPGSVVALHDSKNGTWYLFSFVTSSECALYKVDCAPTISDTTNINTTTWLAVAKKTAITSGKTVINYVDSNGAPASITLTFSAGYLDPGSLTKIVALIPAGTPPLVAGSWSEIGRA